MRRVTFSVGFDGEIGLAPVGQDLEIKLRFLDTTVSQHLSPALVAAVRASLQDFEANRPETGCYGCWVEDGVLGHTPDVPHPVDKSRHTCGMVPRKFIVHCGLCRAKAWVDEMQDAQLFVGWSGRVPSGWGVWAKERCYVCEKCCERPEWKAHGHELMRKKEEKS